MSELSPSPERDPARAVTVFIASKDTAPNRLRALWRMSAEDAKKVCTDPRTAGLRSALHWTETAADAPELWEQCFEYVDDDGRYNGVLAELGVTILDRKGEV